MGTSDEEIANQDKEESMRHLFKVEQSYGAL